MTLNTNPKVRSLLFFDCVGRRLWLRTRWFQVGVKEGKIFPDRFYLQGHRGMWGREGLTWANPVRLRDQERKE